LRGHKGDDPRQENPLAAQTALTMVRTGPRPNQATSGSKITSAAQSKARVKRSQGARIAARTL